MNINLLCVKESLFYFKNTEQKNATAIYIYITYKLNIELNELVNKAWHTYKNVVEIY
jgi:hypothetical protein